MKPVHPDVQAYAFAYRMRLLGHRDIIDNILYATSTRDLAFITMDKNIQSFIQQHKIKRITILSYHEPIGRLGPQ